MWGYFVMPDGPVNWKVSEYNFSQKMQTFTSIESGKSCDLKIIFDPPQPDDNIVIEYYENNAEVPTKTKNLTIVSSIPGMTEENIAYPEYGEYGLNILYPFIDTFYTDVSYSLRVELTDGVAMRVGIKDGDFTYTDNTVVNWIFDNFDEENNSQILYTGEGNEACDMQIFFPSEGVEQKNLIIEYYESMAAAPDFTKTIWIFNENK